jgi:hypothetical protein
MTSTLATAPTLEEILVDALTDHAINSNALADLVDETKTAITVAENDARIAKAAALDPLQSPDPVTARATMENAEFQAARLKSMLPRLQARVTDVGHQEEYISWRKSFDPLKTKVENAAAKLTAFYQKFAPELAVLLSENEKLDAEVARTLAAKPHHVRVAMNDGCYLRSVVLTARGINNFGTYDHKIMDIKLPDWQRPTELLWPPNRQIDWSGVVPAFPKHLGADWWKTQQEDHAEAAAKAEQANAEQQHAEGAKRETRSQSE